MWRWIFLGLVAIACGGTSADGSQDVPPSLEHVRDILIRHGVPPRLVRIEQAPAGQTQGTPRLVFWTKTKRFTQTVVVAMTGEGNFLRLQSAALERVGADHIKLAMLMTYMLDRNFVLTGAQFARDASDGEIVLRSDLPCPGGNIDEKAFLQTLDVLLQTADEERPRLAAILATD